MKENFLYDVEKFIRKEDETEIDDDVFIDLVKSDKQELWLIAKRLETRTELLSLSDKQNIPSDTKEKKNNENDKKKLKLMKTLTTKEIAANTAIDENFSEIILDELPDKFNKKYLDGNNFVSKIQQKICFSKKSDYMFI